MNSSHTNSILSTIEGRRSVRAYTSKRVDREMIQALLRAAVRAPTALHEEQWVFAVVQGRERLKRLSGQTRTPFAGTVGAAMHAPRIHPVEPSEDFNLFYDADTLILIGAQPMGPFVPADCWLAAENLMLAAHAMGLGSCVIGSAVAGLNQDDVKAELGLPAEIQIVVPIIVGWPSTPGTPSPRREPEVLAWISDPLSA